MANGVSNDKIYTLINSTRLELKTDIGELRRQFETLEAGRLTRLEGKMTDFEITQIKRDDTIKQNQAVLSTKFIIISGIGIAIFNAAMYAIFSRLFR